MIAGWVYSEHNMVSENGGLVSSTLSSLGNAVGFDLCTE
jgi:hypothetical protein